MKNNAIFTNSRTPNTHNQFITFLLLPKYSHFTTRISWLEKNISVATDCFKPMEQGLSNGVNYC